MEKITVENSNSPDHKAVLWRAEKILSGIITDTVNLEGNPFTLPEVQTFMDGITVGGHKVSDADQVQNQADSWKHLIKAVRNNVFALDRAMACSLNELVAKEEALEWGVFRDREVSIAGTEWRPPRAKTLDTSFSKMINDVGNITDIFIRSMTLFLTMARNQYFFDGNKRTGRLMMNGILLSEGMDVISIPASKQKEFNEKMIRFYDTGEMVEMFRFLLSCSTAPYNKPTMTPIEV